MVSFRGRRAPEEGDHLHGDKIEQDGRAKLEAGEPEFHLSVNENSQQRGTHEERPADENPGPIRHLVCPEAQDQGSTIVFVCKDGDLHDVSWVAVLNGKPAGDSKSGAGRLTHIYQ